VCFVFADPGHPAIDAFQARGGVEFEHYVVLSNLTAARLMEWRLRSFVDRAAGAAIVLLGFGDQGAKFAGALGARGVEVGRVVVVDDRPERQVAAANLGLRVVGIDDPVLAEAAIIATPLAHVPRFASTLAAAAQRGMPTLDNSLAWDGHPEFVERGQLCLSAAAARSTGQRGTAIRAGDHGLSLTLGVHAERTMRLGGVAVRALQSLGTIALASGHGPSDLAEMGAATSAGFTIESNQRWYLGLAGQSNHIDAAAGIFAARAFLGGLFPEAVAELLPSAHRGALGATAFEGLLARSCTGRSLASPYMSSVEQTALGVLARRYCGCGAASAAVVEIGSALGGSTLLMAAATARDGAADGPRLISIDPDVATRPAMRAAFEVEGYLPRLMQVVSTSDEALPEVRRICRAAGMVFIDGLHTEAAASRDFENYAPLVRRGGCIAFHDCDVRHAGVLRTVARIAASDRRFALRCVVDTLAVFERIG
jgi:predicted O-methyltransferase YrrM